MPVATPEVYAQMIDRAKEGRFAYPAINVSSSQTLNAALQGFAEAGSDGIIQVSTGGSEYFSGPTIKDKVAGASAFAAFAQEVAKNYPINVALHTDHCPKDKLDSFVRPLLAISEERVKNGQLPLFQSHMWDGSAETLDDNIKLAVELLAMSKKANTILEIEIGAVGGEEDGVSAEINEKLYTTVADGLRTVEVLGLGEKGRYMTALTFGNVHGVYKPGAVKLRPEVLKEIQDAVGAKHGKERPFDLVFHGGSGSSPQEISDAVDFGVVKMNIDTDTQYAFTRPVADHMLRNYDGVLKIDGEVGNKKQYDPRAWGKAAEKGMAARVVEVGIRRHVGTVSDLFTPTGKKQIVRGKDLTAIRWIIGTGGALTRIPGGDEILGRIRLGAGARLLPPPEARILIDRDYRFSALGTLAQVYHEEVAATFRDWVAGEVGELPEPIEDETPEG